MGVKVPAHYRPKVTSAILSSWVVHNLVNRESHPCRVGEAQCRCGGQIVGGKHPSNPIAGDCHDRTVPLRMLTARPTTSSAWNDHSGRHVKRSSTE